MQQRMSDCACYTLQRPSPSLRAGVSWRREHSASKRLTPHASSAPQHPAHVPEAMQLPRQRLQQLFGHKAKTLLLERSIDARSGADAALWDAVPFAGQIFPDLPIASSWSGLLQAALRRVEVDAAPHVTQHATGKDELRAGSAPADPGPSSRPQVYTIRTVAAQVRSQRAIEERMLRLTDQEHASADEPAADALLCLSGSHPARRLPGSSRWLASSFDVLRMAANLRAEGQLPAQTSIWAAENPLTSHPSRFEAKVEAGAETIVTQPPLVWGRVEKWYEDLDRRGMIRDTRLVVGLPMLTSPGNLRFWAALCDCPRGDEGIAAVLADFERAAAAGKPRLQQFCREWNADLLRKVQELPGVSGVHVMPLTGAARKLAQELLPRREHTTTE